MSITLGDILKHNNPIFPIVDIVDVKGGIRTIATFSNTDLYNAFSGIPDKLKQNYTNLIVTGTSQHYYLSGTDSTITTSWTLTGSGLSATGTTNSIAKWTGSTSLGDSLITDNGDTITINGNLNVIGTSSTITSQNLLIKDPIILLAGSQSTPLFDSGLFVNRGTGDTQAFIWDESETEFKFISTTSSSTTLGSVSIGTYSSVRTGPLSIGTGTASNSRFVVSSSGGTTSLVVNESGATNLIYDSPYSYNTTANALVIKNPNGSAASMGVTTDGNLRLFAQSLALVNGSDELWFNRFGQASIQAFSGPLVFYRNTDIETMRIMNNTGYIGIGTASPSTKLHVYATQSGAFRLQDGTEQNDYILKSDSNGVASWVSLSTIGISGASGSVPKFTGTSSLGNSRFFDDGTTGSYGSGTSRVYFLTGGNTWLTLNRSQAAMSFILGNPQSPLFQLGQIQSTNTLGLSIESAGYTIFKIGASYSSSLTIDLNGVYNQIKGISNTIYGYQALLVGTSSTNNTVFGYQVLYSNTTGGDNTTIGCQSLYNNNNGSENIAIGVFSQFSATSSSYNVSMGNYSLYNNIADSNIAIGYQSLYSNTTSYNNTAIGFLSLYNNTTSVNTISILSGGSGYTASSTFSSVQLNYISGSTALTYPIATIHTDLTGVVDSVTLETKGTGFKNTTTIMGANLGTGTTFSISINSLSSGNHNTAVGANSLYYNSTGYESVSIGVNSLFNNTTGYQNTAIGFSSMTSNTTGYHNTAVGYRTLQSNKIGWGNVVVGNNSLSTATQSSYNTIVGYNTLPNNSSGQQNTAIGFGSLQSNTTGTSNSTLGMYTLLYNTTGSNNISIGQNCLLFNTTGSYNIAMGTSAGTFDILSNGVTSSNTSIFIGDNTKTQSVNQSNQIVIGYGATGSGSNSVTLGASTITKTQLRGIINIGTVPSYNNNGDAITGGLVPGDIYRTSTYVLMVVV
jgi:hypothetical protein